MSSSKTTIAIFGGAWQDTTVRALSGAMQYAAENPGVCILNLLSLSDLTNHKTMPQIWKGRADGVITVVGHFDGEKTSAQWILEAGVPATSLTFDWLHPSIPAINTSPDAIAELVVDHLAACDCRSFGFAGSSVSQGSNFRRDAYISALKTMGYEGVVSVDCTDNLTGTAEDETKVARQTALAAMLTKAAKPVGVYAINDKIARMTCLVVRELGLRIPEDVAVVGVNDSILARTGNPPLTCVAVDGEQIGYRAAEVVHNMIRGKKPAHSRIELPPLRLIPRESTIGSLTGHDDLRRALEHIRQHSATGVTVDDVADAINVSRTSLEQLFRKIVGHSPGKEIQQVRFAHAKELLLETDYTISQISEMVGFAESAAFSKFFRRLAGKTPRDFRRHKSGDVHQADDAGELEAAKPK